MIMAEGLISRLLSIRKKKKAKKPDFVRQESYRHVKLDDSWRRPTGRHSKLRKGLKTRGKKPSAGFGSPIAVKGLIGSGKAPVHVSTVSDLKAIDKKTQCAVIRSAVGRKKRMDIAKEAEGLGIEVVNAYREKVRSSR